MAAYEKADVYQIITDRIVEIMEKGVPHGANLGTEGLTAAPGISSAKNTIKGSMHFSCPASRTQPLIG